MLLLLDIGNTHTHVAFAPRSQVRGRKEILTKRWFDGSAASELESLIAGRRISAAAICSVVPAATPIARDLIQSIRGISTFELTCKTSGRLGIDYPKPETIGADRLANAIAARTLCKPPVAMTWS